MSGGKIHVLIIDDHSVSFLFPFTAELYHRINQNKTGASFSTGRGEWWDPAHPNNSFHHTFDNRPLAIYREGILELNMERKERIDEVEFQSHWAEDGPALNASL